MLVCSVQHSSNRCEGQLFGNPSTFHNNLNKGTKMKFQLGTKVLIAISGEAGQIIGRAEYLDSHPQYYVRYTAADGRATTAWWEESALVMSN